MIKKSLFTSIKKNVFLYIGLLLLTGLIVVAELAPAKILEHVINDCLKGTNPALTLLLELSCLYVGAIILVSAFDFLKQVLLIALGQSFTMELRKNMARKLKSVEGIFFSKFDSGTISSYFANDVEAINSLFTDGVLSMIIDLLKVLGIVVEMFLYSYVLGLITICIIPIIYVISVVFKKKMLRAQVKSRKIIATINNNISETVKNDKLIKIYSKEEYMAHLNEGYLNDNLSKANSVAFLDSLYSPVIQIITALVVCIVSLFVHKDMVMGLTIGALAGAIEYISALFTPVESLGMEIQKIQKAMSGFKRIQEFSSIREETKKSNFTINDIIKEKNQLVIKNLSFYYVKDNPVLKNIDLSFIQDNRYVLVGRTGVGKTTIFRLIEGIIEPVSGQILLNGIDVTVIPNELKHLIFGYVSQEFKAIKGSIKENISMKNNSLADADIYDALNIVGLLDKVKEFPNGIETIYNEEMFSNGEKSLLSIARAIAFKPIILLLDEITAGVDSITEDTLNKAIAKSGKNKIIIEISHRRGNTIDSSIVYKIENGEIAND